MNGDLRAQLRAWLSKQGRRRQQQQQEMFLEEQQEEQQQQHLEVEEEGDNRTAAAGPSSGTLSQKLQAAKALQLNILGGNVTAADLRTAQTLVAAVCATPRLRRRRVIVFAPSYNHAKKLHKLFRGLLMLREPDADKTVGIRSSQPVPETWTHPHRV